jgi:hypothetical protein
MGLLYFEGPADLPMLNARLPALFLADDEASERFWEFFVANIRNKNTRRAYYKAACRFSDWCEGRGLKVAGLQDDPEGLLFRTVAGKTGRLTTLPLSQADACRLIRWRAKAAGIQTKIGNHTFRATRITAYLKNGGKLEIAQQIAAHESSRTTGLYDRRDHDVNLDALSLLFPPVPITQSSTLASSTTLRRPVLPPNLECTSVQ